MKRRSSSDRLLFWALFTIGLFSLGRALAATSASLTLAGYIPSKWTMRVVGLNAEPLSHDDGSALNNDTELVRIVELNNAPGLFSIRLSSAEHGALKDSADGQRFDYRLRYNSEPVDLARGETLVNSGYRNAGQETVHVLRVKLPAAAAARPMSDTLTFSIAAD